MAGPRHASGSNRKKDISEERPTHFGLVDYEIDSDVDDGRITATVKMTSRTSAREVWMRLRHPKSAPIKSVKVNGKEWRDFDPSKEVVRLHGVTETVTVEVN